ncbi:two component transcriptional regulator, winged helix family [Gloeothece citriformis PCC 7424]|uniref:Two component transcriptional regulator, winged helix family n=1 Tax=Gloeothece citriformis (strain PCC 7424) TaxID=65393 RepID=B7KKG6_GLOC7|nr:two-component system response regulator RppA [Gloeothece citriformis]ACK72299.1 two component transcriptional regulator, winged helix family [Gloeothece citriformis PCC 7424]
MRILLVEDDPKQLKPLLTALSHAQHTVDGVQDGETAQWLLSEREYDLLILDWMLPHISGIDLCRQYRSKKKATPILLLTAKDTTSDKVAGLDAGADDYLVKPIDVMEFLARVRALGRRSLQWQEECLSIADLMLQPAHLSIKRGDHSTSLSSQEFKLLEYFLRHPRQILTRDQIEQAIWEWDIQPENNTITALIRRLRQRLRNVGANHWIETIYGMGYRLNPPF